MCICEYCIKYILYPSAVGVRDLYKQFPIVSLTYLGQVLSPANNLAMLVTLPRLHSKLAQPRGASLETAWSSVFS